MSFRSALLEIKSLLSLALPVGGGLLVSGGLVTIESLFIGRLGPLPLGAMSLTASALCVPYYLVWGWLYPLGVWIGRGYGAGDHEQVAIELRHSLLIGAVLGLLTGLAVMACWWLLPMLGQPPEVLAILKPYWMLCAAGMLPYGILCTLRSFLEAIERQDIALWMGGVMLVIAVPSHYALIFGFAGMPGFGLTGAGLAFVLSEWSTVLFAALVIAMNKYFVPYRQAVRFSYSVLKRQLVEGLPVCLQNCLIGAAYACVGFMIGWLGALPLAVNQVIMNVFGTIYMIPVALSTAVMVRVAQAHGQGREENARAIGHAAFGLTAVICGIIALILITCGRPLAAAFTDDLAVIDAAIIGFIVLALMQFADGMECVSQSAVIGMGDHAWPTRVVASSFWLISVPCAAVFALMFNGGVAGAWIGFSLGLVVAAARLIWRFEHLNRPPLASGDHDSHISSVGA